MAECKTQRCHREAERAPSAQGRCILHAQRLLQNKPVDHDEPKDEKVEWTPADDLVEDNDEA